MNTSVSRGTGKRPVSWSPDYVDLFAWRQKQLLLFRSNPAMIAAARAYYSQPEHCADFISDWVDTYDPRNAGQGDKLTRMPFVLFPRQRDLVDFLMACLVGEANGLVEKCRDAGATWVCVGVSVWLWLFWPGVAVGWGSRKEDLVDRIGVMDSIFEKIRSVIRGLPPEFMPRGFNEKDHMPFMRVMNPETDATIVGESGDNIGRGGRTRIYFKDESAHYERPELIEAALGDNTRVQIDISSVRGLGNVFHNKRKAGVEWETGAPAIQGKTNVFVFDWRQHPDKDDAWYNRVRQEKEDAGLLHIFAQEVDRDYASSVEGIIIKPAWVRAAIDAHLKLNLDTGGAWSAALDVADEGGDQNAWSARRGIVLMQVESWGEGDTGETARRAIGYCTPLKPSVDLSYDCIGVGAGVKSEVNRLRQELILPKHIRVTPWNAGDGPLFPEAHVIPKDKESPLNNELYLNLKAQGWWELRHRFYRTWQAVTQGVSHPIESLISLNSATISPVMLTRLIDELSQATHSLSPGRLKLMVNKSPKGTKSPNVADSVMMNYWPVNIRRYTMMENL